MEETSIQNSFTKELTSVKDILQASIEHPRNLNIIKMAGKLDPGTEDGGILSYLVEEDAGGRRILQTLYARETANNATPPVSKSP